MLKVYVDGQEGTTGLQIHSRLDGRDDIELLQIDASLRRDIDERKRLINSADVVFLCLPDDAAREAVGLVENDNTIIIDASTAHRTLDSWSYGFPELSPAHLKKIKSSRRIAVPGCHASGFNALVYPLIASGIINNDYPITCTSITGYSGGGKKMIADYEDINRADFFKSTRPYALTLSHKHLPEMKKVCELKYTPHFVPILGDFPQGMIVQIPLITRLMNKKMSAAEVQQFFADYYKNQQYIKVKDFGDNAQTPLDATALVGTNNMEIFVFGNDENILLCARLDNLGKGASGAAVQILDLILASEH